jgi:hypothetical protein
MSKRYSGKSFKDSSVSKKPKLSLKEKRKQIIEKKQLNKKDNFDKSVKEKEKSINTQGLQ